MNFTLGNKGVGTEKLICACGDVVPYIYIYL